MINIYIVYGLDNWPLSPCNNFVIKNILFGVFKSKKNTIKSKLFYNGSGVAFDGVENWNIDDGFASNVLIFGLDIS